MSRSGLSRMAVPLSLAVALCPGIAVAQVDPPAAPFNTSAIDDAALGASSGREDVAQLSTASQVAGVSRSSVGDHVSTGDARVSDNALQNLSGLSILNVNSGNNVAINAAMNVNIAIRPAP